MGGDLSRGRFIASRSNEQETKKPLPIRRCEREAVLYRAGIARLCLSLGELEPTSSAALAVLFAFLHSAVAGEEAAAAEGDFEALVELGECPAEAHDNRAGLPGRSAAGGVDEDVHLAAGVGDLEGAEDGLAVAFVGEVVV